MGGAAVRVAGGLFLLIGLVAVLARLVEPVAPSPAPQVAAFVPWALPAWALALGLLLAGGTRVPALLALVGLAVQVSWVIPPAAARATTGGQGVALTVMTQNAQYGQADAAQLMAQARRADVLVVAELTPGLVDRLQAAGIGAVLPFADLLARDGASGTGIWSRYPLRPAGHLADTGFAMPRAVVAVPGTAGVTVTGVHTRAPRSVAIPGWRHDLAAIATDQRSRADQAGRAGRAGRAEIVTGDFNASRDHGEFRAILATGLVDAADAHPLWVWRPWPSGLTWPADRAFPPLTRIDHVLVSRGRIRVQQVQVVRVAGTDHRGVVARLLVSSA